MEKSKIAKTIDGTDNPMVTFKPKKEFYEKTGIRQKRFGAIYRGEKSPNLVELKSISEYFTIPIQKFIE